MSFCTCHWNCKLFHNTMLWQLNQFTNALLILVCNTCFCRESGLRPDQFDFSFHGPDRPKILGIPKKRKRGVAMHGQIAAVRGYSLRLLVLFSHYQAQNYCEAKYSWKETFGEVICKLNPKSVESKVNINEIHFFFCLPIPTHILAKLIRETRN